MSENVIVNFSTSNGDFLLVKVASDAQCFETDSQFGKPELIFYKGIPSFKNIQSIELPAGKYSILGLTSELTEEQWKGVIPQIRTNGGTTYFPEYPLEKVQGARRAKVGFNHAKQSGRSLLISLKVYKKNPYKEPNEKDYGRHDGNYTIAPFITEAEIEADYKKWQEAESRSGSWLLLKKIV